MDAHVVLAETATTLYRDSKYNDLISFEEDIARIASIVLVIPESPGSLAELGAFATNDTIRHALRVVMQERFEKDESFIRFGPIQRIIKSHGRDFVGFYPWRTRSSQHVIIASIVPHYTNVLKFINGHLNKIPHSTILLATSDALMFCVIYWVTNILFVVSEELLTSCIISLVPNATHEDILNKIYCMLHISGWLKKIAYSGKDYYYAAFEEDPFNYAYKTGTRERDTMRRKADVTRAMKIIEDTPNHVVRWAFKNRSPRVK